MSDQLPSDSLLARMKADAQTRIAVRPSIVSPPPYVTAEELLALIECAEIVQTDYLLLSQNQQMRAMKALKELGE